MTTARTYPTLDQQQVAQQLGEVREEIARCIIGLEDEITLLLCAVISGRHVLVEGVPGLGKTMLIKTLARTVGCSFRRIQFTPDLLPADILGGYVYNPKTGKVEPVTVKRHSDLLAMFALKKMRPEYRDRVDADIHLRVGALPLAAAEIEKMTEEELDAIILAGARRLGPLPLPPADKDVIDVTPDDGDTGAEGLSLDDE